MPRYMMLVVTNDETETAPGCSPDSDAKPRDMLQPMTNFNQGLADAGLLLDRDGYRPTSEGYRVHFSETDVPRVKRGPFHLAKQGVVSGHWILKADNVETVLGWAKTVHFKGDQVGVHRITELEEFGDALTDEMRGRLRFQVEKEV